jgi:hypothetical protein
MTGVECATAFARDGYRQRWRERKRDGEMEGAARFVWHLGRRQTATMDTNEPGWAGQVPCTESRHVRGRMRVRVRVEARVWHREKRRRGTYTHRHKRTQSSIDASPFRGSRGRNRSRSRSRVGTASERPSVWRRLMMAGMTIKVACKPLQE